MLMIARRRNKCELSTIGIPLHVGPLTTAAYKIVAECRAMLIGRRLQPDHPWSVYLDYHPLYGRGYVVTGKRILPRLQIRMADPGINQVHLADATLVLLKGGDLFRIR